MFGPVTHVLPITVIRRERFLPVSGKVLVRAQQKVVATDVIAEVNLQPEYLLLDIARGLGIPAERADRYIKCKVDDQLTEGDVVAGPVGLTRRLIRSPRNGKTILTGNGQVLLELSGLPFRIKAGLTGTVTELIGDRGAVIETTGALIQGVWGNGGVENGIMTILKQASNQRLVMSDIDISARGSIVVVTHCADPEALKFAEELPLRGLILASMTPDLIPVAKKLQIPILVLEGFGRVSMNSSTSKLLNTSDKREIAVNAEPWNRFAGTRPEIVIPLSAPGNITTPQEVGIYALGRRVHVLRPPKAGEIGTIIGLKDSASFPGGLRATAVEVHLESGEKHVFPIANLELLA
jgi:hypothetical protein